MSVLCCRIPAFALTLSLPQPDPDRPLALLGPDATICAATPAAQRAGVQSGQTPAQAQRRCPDLTLQPLDLARCAAEQTALLDTLAAWELPVEAQGWGLAYVDLHPLTQRSDEVQTLAAGLGRRLRQRLGERLQPSLGWDSGKFTARAAAHSVDPGHMRLVAKPHEGRFLRPLPLSLLPLPPAAQLQLHWLGIRTLGQFADLPTPAVTQRFGQVGRTAQRWAQGRDDRPVRPTHTALVPTLEIAFDPSATQLDPVVAALMAALQPTLDRLAGQLSGCTRLRLTCAFLDGTTQPLDLIWVEPVSQAARLAAHLKNRLAALVWPGPLERLTVTHLDSAELPAHRPTLWGDCPEEAGELPSAIAQRLLRRYGPIFWQGTVVDAGHPLDAQRIALVGLP